jgi:acetyltransferase-like isoleucine patch superfamily enzyme
MPLRPGGVVQQDRTLVRQLAGTLRRNGPAITLAARRAARLAFLARTRIAAALADAHVELDVHPDAIISPGTRVEVWPGTRTAVRLGPGSSLGDRTLLSLRGGWLSVGADAQVRRLATLQVTGDLSVGAGVVLSTGLVVHCAESVAIGDLTIIGEHSTIADSAHLRTPPGTPVHHATSTAAVVIGANCWLGAGVVVAAGVTIGDQCFIGAGSVVTRDVEAGWLAAGIPAKPVRRLDEDG